MTIATTDIHLKGLGPQKMAALTKKARRLGLSPDAYVKTLVEEDLAITRAARSTTFQKLLGPGRDVDEQELDQLVDRARTSHHRKMLRKR